MNKREAMRVINEDLKVLFDKRTFAINKGEPQKGIEYSRLIKDSISMIDVINSCPNGESEYDYLYEDTFDILIYTSNKMDDGFTKIIGLKPTCTIINNHKFVGGIWCDKPFKQNFYEDVYEKLIEISNGKNRLRLSIRPKYNIQDEKAMEFDKNYLNDVARGLNKFLQSKFEQAQIYDYVNNIEFKL